MLYSKLQKFLSSLILFSMLGGLIFRVPFFDFKTFAGNSEFYNLVSIIVDDETYDDIDSELNKYAKDIQGVLENTKVVILPTPKNTPAFNIASMNEALYYEGYKSLDSNTDFESKLIGTVLVGDFNLPIVFDGNNSSKTIVPFTDFEDKNYVYNHVNNRYEKNENNLDGLKSEIWHGVISPNFGDENKNINGLKDYFNKNHDYYSGTGNFKFSQGILNGSKNTGVNSNYDPFVFYYDQFREEKALNYNSYIGYKGFLDNKEDIVYNRFTKELADKLSNEILGESNNEIVELTETLQSKINNLGSDSPFNNINEDVITSLGNIPDTTNVPDIQTRYITEEIPKKFLEIFAKGVIGEFRNEVHNAGRYNENGTEINMDLIPYLITVLDLVNDEIVKDINNEIENEIDNLVKNGLSRNIALPTKFVDNNSNVCNDIYQNYLYGTKAEDITNASQCSIYRGSIANGGKLVEANRGNNINLLQGDLAKIPSNYCSTKLISGSSLNGWWGKNTPLNIDRNQVSDGEITLSTHDLNGSITPIYNIGGSKEIFDNSKIYSPLNCFENNYILAEENDYDNFDYSCETVYRIPTFGTPINWSCTNDNNSSGKTFNFLSSFEENYINQYSKTCTRSNIFLNGTNVINKYISEYEFECSGINNINNYYYKKISSYIVHKSPDAYELKEEIKSMITESLPVDKNRYIDFISAKGNYQKIEYPALFRLDIGDEINIDFNIVSNSLNKLLDEKSNEINEIIKNNNPSSLNGSDLEIYNLLKTGPYPDSIFDLEKFLKDKEDKILTVQNESKTISYYDTLVFAQYWNSLNSISAKYGFIFDNYLSDQFGDEDSNYFLPKNKKQYEIAYLGADGDAQNMYIKMDPEGKADNPYGNILGDNINISSSFLGLSIGGNLSNDRTSKCAPPDGVPIWEWVPAVMCRLGEIMPPSISFSDGVCGPSLLTSDEQDKFNEGAKDANKNGINDCIEKKLLNSGKLELTADSEKYFYNKNAKLKATIIDKEGKIVKGVNNTKINFEIIKIEEAKDKTKDLDKNNVKVVFDKEDIYNYDESTLSKYVAFKNFAIPTKLGVSEYGIGLKGIESNIYLRAYIGINDSSGEEVIFIESELLEIQIRGDKLFNTSYKLKNTDDGLKIDYGINSLIVSDKTNVFLSDGYINNIDSISNVVNNSSLSKEKLVLLINNISTTGKSIELSYPLNIKIFDSDENEIDEQKISRGDIGLFKGIIAFKKSGNYKIEIIDNVGYKTIKNLELLPDVPNSIDINLGTTIMEVGGNVSTNFITIYDKYLNPTVGNFYNINFEIDGEGVNFLDNESNKFSANTIEGYKIFRLKSTNKEGNNKINISITDLDDNELVKGAKSLEVLEGINFVAKPLSGDIKVGGGTYKYEISLRNKNGSILSDFNSRAYLIADPIFLESTNPYFELKNGIAEIEFQTKIIAGKNINIEFQVEGLNKIIQKEITILPGDPMKMDLILSKNKIEASTDSSSVLQVELKDRYNNIVFNDNSTNTSLEILDKYSYIITSNKSSSKVSEGITTYDIYGTLNPGVAYFKVGTNPSLGVNSFTIKDENGDMIINGVGENVGKIETFYFWNKAKLDGKKYNSIYTTLLGSNYGDIYEQDYLAGSLLFNKDNRSLVVTSLLNNSSNYSNVLTFRNSGGIQSIYNNNDLTQDIELSTIFKDSKLGLNIYNSALNIYVGEVFYNFDDNTKLISCDSTISFCIDDKETSISLKTISEKYKAYLDNDKLILRDIYGKNLLEILDDGTINRFGSIEFEFDEDNTSEYLIINIKTGGNIIAKLGLNFVNSITNISRNINIFNSKIDSVKNSILVLLKTNSYSTYNSGNLSNNYKTLYYNDPFASDFSLNTFSKSNLDGIENFPKKSGIGWKEGNKSLLAFSAGKTVGESVADYMSFSVINLGDPVISLKKIKEKLPSTDIDRKFDSTIGKLVSKDDDIVGYQVFDYDNDSRNDILLIKDNNYLKLLENKQVEKQLLDKGNLANIVDLGNHELVKTGDFTGDGFDDIFFVNNKGNPFLLNNVTKDFFRYSLVDNFRLAGRIVRAEQFDMDNDGISDIVTLDEAGEINIFYGGGTSINPHFTKLNVSNNHGVELSSDIRNDNSLVYFDELIQPGKIPSVNDKINNFLFVKYPYSTDEIDVNYENVLNGTEELPNEISSSYFIKSEYSESAGIKIEKVYIDNNGGFISTDDIVEVEIILTNLSGKKLRNIVFADKVPEIFTLDKNSIISDIDSNIVNGNMGYHYLISDFDLNNNESITISYKAKIKPIKYGYIEVGLFEKDEIGDDKYGDVLLKEDNQNCSGNTDIFRSLNSRSYSKGVKTPICNEDKIKLPTELEQNTFDVDGNGVPDYIDRLSNPNNTEALQEYSRDQLENMFEDSDNDGLPDSEDFFDMDGSITFDLGGIGQNIDEGLNKAQELLNSLNCSNSSCFATPLNWAPLAPGNDPVFMGKLIGDGLKVNEGLPIFSALTGKWYGPVWGPSVWPISVLGYDTMRPGAGGWLGTDSYTNFFRLFVTPTLTGGMGTAVCFGGSANIFGNIPPKTVSPLTPGGNCIVIANKMTCNSDGSGGDVASTGFPTYSGNGNFGIINGNCNPEDNEIAPLIKKEQVDIYLKNDNDGFVQDAFDFLPGVFSEEPITPMFITGNGGDVDIELDLSSYNNGNFDDIIEINKTRITPFPSWLMDWVTRQIEEIVNKLTDFPTIFIILPDFNGVFDGNWGETSQNNLDADYIGTDKTLEENGLVKDFKNNKTIKQVNSGIKEAYEFIGSTPLVYIKQETVNITVPWISQAEIDKKEIERTKILQQRKDERDKAIKGWKLSDPLFDLQIFTDLDLLINGLEKNLEIIKEYKKIPEQINKLINKKEDYLEQVLCNIEIISSILGGRIGKNGQIFKTWVELYILIKAILKSWQLIVDVFLDYETECHECKNERQDALDEEFSLIDMLIPKIPVIRFPKWPDIILDLHNIRAGLTVSLPEFNVNTKPILLPSLPKLYLPKVPSVNLILELELPKLPILQSIKIGELPPLPTLPTINLPDLPPPPKLPKMLASIEVILDIIKLITKAMCLLKTLPIHPEWRAGDQIAFLTERNGYLGSDFFEVSMPEFSFPFLDAIKVTTYVNLEFETDFIVELARQVAMPLNSFSNDFTNIFDLAIPDLDFRDVLPQTIDGSIDIGKDGVNTNFGLNNSDKLKALLAQRLVTNFTHLASYVKENKDIEVDNLKFKQLVNKALSSNSVVNNPKAEKIIAVWNEVNNLTYSKENALIKELQDNNTEKFEAITDIINTEIIKNKELKKKLNNIGSKSIITKVGFNDESNKIDLYNETLSKYNNKFIETAKKLINPDTSLNDKLKEEGNNLISSIKTPLTKYSESLSTKTEKRLLSAVTSTSTNTNTTSINSCQAQANSDYRYNYEGLYIIEDDISYRLFDYLDELQGDEVIKIVDIDNDNDEDILYFANKQLFIKENLKVSNSGIYLSTNPLIVDINNNKFLNGNIFYEAINGAKEIGSDNGSINIGFTSPTNKEVNNFRMGFYNRADKYLNESNISYRPEFIKKNIIDAVAGIDDITKIDENELFIKRKNLSYINNVGNLKGVKLKTTDLININDNLSKNEIVNIIKGTVLYAGGNAFTLQYILDNNNDEKVKSLSIAKHQNIELLNDIKIIGISGDAYIEGKNELILEGIDIRNHLNKPLFSGNSISYIGNNYEVGSESYVEIRYYDDSKIGIDFELTTSWELYDLGNITSDYFVRINKENDYYYLKINSFKDNIEGTLSKQILLAPQLAADENAPDLNMSSIKMPIYQKQIIDLTNYIYEYGGVKNISNVIVDLDLEIDSDGNGNTKDDNDSNLDGIYKNKVTVHHSLISLKLELGKFDNIFKKKIGITLIDNNNNVGYKEVTLEVYTPTPQIIDYSNGSIKGYIDESLTDEPIDIYRFRGGVITKLENSEGLSKIGTDNGNYSFDVISNGSGLSLYRDSNEIASINENTGKITFKDFSLQTKVLSSNNIDNDLVFPKIIITDGINDIFYEYINMEGVNNVQYVDDFDVLKEKGIYFKFTDTTYYNYYNIPEGLDYNPGALSIYRNTDLNKDELFTIFIDGRINTINFNYKLEYDSYKDYIILKLIDSHFNREVGRVLFITDSEYIMK